MVSNDTSCARISIACSRICCSCCGVSSVIDASSPLFPLIVFGLHLIFLDDRPAVPPPPKPLQQASALIDLGLEAGGGMPLLRIKGELGRGPSEHQRMMKLDRLARRRRLIALAGHEERRRSDLMGMHQGAAVVEYAADLIGGTARIER